MRILMLSAAAILIGCSAAPPKSEMTASAPAPTSEAAEGSDAAQETKQGFKPPPGYKAKIKEWDIVYCRKMPILGSRFPKEICMTEAELKEHMAAMETMKSDKDQVSRVCSVAAGCAGN